MSGRSELSTRQAMTLLLQTEELVADRRAVRVADVTAATQAALVRLERLQAVAAATAGARSGASGGTGGGAAAAAVDIDTADIQQQLLAAAGDTAGTLAERSSPVPATAMTSNASILGPGMGAPFSIQSNESYQSPEGKAVPCDKAVEVLVRMLAEKETVIAQQYRAAARQAIQGMQSDVLRSTQRHEDLRPDNFLSRVRRILPAEYLAAWSAWTGIFSLINADNNVMFGMWALYSALALVYVYLRLVKDRRTKDAVDTAELAREQPAVLVMLGGPNSRVGPDTGKMVGAKADPLAMVPSAAGAEAVSISHFSEKREIPEDTLEAPSAEGGSGSEAMGGGGASGPKWMTRRWRGGKGGGMERAAAEKVKPPVRTPTNGQLFLQALVSAAAFLLLSAFAADIHTTIGAPVWVFFAPVAPFALFAQFVLPDGLVGRR
eukprot:jgi/Ulvmu1/3470/UM016_0090.1